MSINDYRILRVVGKGSFATVFKAVRRDNNQPVAIKIFTRKLSKQEQELARKEVSISRQIDHRNIIHMYDEFRRNDTWYMVFQYCGCGDLEKLVGKKGMLKEETVALLAVELVEAVFFLAENNIAHRDIKAANILLTDKFEVKLADLGFAKAVHHEEDFLKSYAGTPLIMAPEIFESGKYTNKCDIWSLGVVFYQLLCGMMPFHPKQGGMEELIQLVKNGKLEFPKQVPLTAEAKDFILKCLEKNPSKRASAGELRTHPWLVKARQSQVQLNVMQASLPNLLSALYTQESRIFGGCMDEEEMIDDTRVVVEVNNCLKRMLDSFTLEYQQSVERFHRSYRSLLTLFRQKEDNPKGIHYLQQYLNWKCDEVERFKLRLLLPDNSFEINAQEFGKPRVAVEHLRKLLPLDFLPDSTLEMQVKVPRQLLRCFAKIMQNHTKALGETQTVQYTNSLSALLRSAFDSYTLSANVCSSLAPELSTLALRGIKDISRNDVLRLLVNKKSTDLGIALMDVLNIERRSTTHLQPNLQTLLGAMEIPAAEASK